MPDGPRGVGTDRRAALRIGPEFVSEPYSDNVHGHREGDFTGQADVAQW